MGWRGAESMKELPEAKKNAWRGNARCLAPGYRNKHILSEKAYIKRKSDPLS